MNKKIILYVVVMVIFATLVIADDYTNGGGTSYTPQSESEDESDGGDSPSDDTGYLPGEDDTTSGSTSTLEEFCNNNPICTSLQLAQGIYCFDDDRGDYRTVVTSFDSWYGYAKPEDSEVTDESLHNLLYFIKYDYGDVNAYLSEPFFNEGYDIEYVGEEDGYWKYTSTDARFFHWPTNEYSISIPWYSGTSLADNIRLYRYEGKGYQSDPYFPEYKGCRAFGGFYFIYNITGAIVGIDQNYLTYNPDPWAFQVWPGEWIDLTSDTLDTYRNLIWDSQEDSCTKIGGTWLDDDDFNDGADNYYQCCGDDYVWVNNRPITDLEFTNLDADTLDEQKTIISEYSDEEQESLLIDLADEYCLYFLKNDGTPIEVNPFGDEYSCEKTDFKSYDPTLKLEEDYNDQCYGTDSEGNSYLLSTCPYVFTRMYTASDDDADTDLGKWTDNSQSNPYVCRIASTNNAIPTFEWSQLEDAGDAVGTNGLPLDIYGNEITDLSDDSARASTICEKYLGGKWTGSHCCGNKYAYDSTYHGYTGTPSYVNDSYSELTPITYSDGTVIHQYACLQGEAYDDYDRASSAGSSSTVRYIDTDPIVNVELLNVDGSWYGCNIDTATTIPLMDKDWYSGTDLISTERNANKCNFTENKFLCNYNASNDQWEWYSVTGSDIEGTYVRDTLGYDSRTANTFTYSDPPWSDTYDQNFACCAGNSCWDGTTCVADYTSYSMDSDGDAENEYYICYQGSWTGEIQTKYDWYHNTDGAAIDYCVDDYSCVCSSNEDDDTFCVPEGDYFTEGCTLTENFYKDDHLCESTGGVGNWTSRTKLLAFQLMQLAGTTQYTLFCDQYTNTLPDYLNVASIEKYINSFCVLKQGDAITFGVTFNSDDEEEPMNLSQDVYDDINEGFSTIIGEDVDCTDAIASSSLTTFPGTYSECDTDTDKTVFYNEKIDGIIYIKDGYTSTTLPSFTSSTYQDIFDNYKSKMTTYIEDADSITGPTSSAIIKDDDDNYFSSFDYIADYSSMYYNSAGVFGVQDLKYNDEGANRYYMGVYYNPSASITLDCNQVYEPYDDAAQVHCNETNGLVLERSTEGSAYWTSLTAGMRQE